MSVARLLVMLFFLLAASSFAGCGNKGPLYLPKPKPETNSEIKPESAVELGSE